MRRDHWAAACWVLSPELNSTAYLLPLASGLKAPVTTHHNQSPQTTTSFVEGEWSWKLLVWWLHLVVLPPRFRGYGGKRRGADPQLSRLPCPAGILLKRAHFSPLPCLVLWSCGGDQTEVNYLEFLFLWLQIDYLYSILINTKLHTAILWSAKVYRRMYSNWKGRIWILSEIKSLHLSSDLWGALLQILIIVSSGPRQD